MSCEPGPDALRSAPELAENKSMSTVAGSNAVPAASADQPAPTWSS